MATAEVPTKVQNYRVVRGWFGAYPAGSVIPEFAAKLAGDVSELVRRGILEPTDAPANAKIGTPRVATTPAVADDAIAELHRLRDENARLLGDNRRLLAAVGAADQRVSAFQTEIARYVEENSGLRRVIESRAAELKALSDDYNRLGEQYKAAVAESDGLRKELDAATAPAKESKRK